VERCQCQWEENGGEEAKKKKHKKRIEGTNGSLSSEAGVEYLAEEGFLEGKIIKSWSVLLKEELFTVKRDASRPLRPSSGI
jgi:hypothetical protein